MDTALAALYLALLAFGLSAPAFFIAVRLKRGPRGPRGFQGEWGRTGPPGPPGTPPSLDAICDRVVEILDPQAGAALIHELGSRWPVAAIPSGELKSISKGVDLLAHFLDNHRGRYLSFLIVGQFDPERDRPSQFGGASSIRDAEIAIGVTDDALYIVKDRYDHPRVIEGVEQI